MDGIIFGGSGIDPRDYDGSSFIDPVGYDGGTGADPEGAPCRR